MPTELGASVAIIRAGQILLIKREDSDAWGLPTGGVEAGESVAQAAIREAYEETGVEVELTGLVGVYSLPLWTEIGNHVVVFKGKPIGGTLLPQKGEVSAVGYFAPHQLPSPLIGWHRRRILDALSKVGGSVAWTQNARLPLPREKMLELYSRSGLSKSDFFLKYFGTYAPGDEHLEVGGEVTI